MTKRKTRWGTNKALVELFRILNKEFFDNKLPHVRVEWETNKIPIKGNILARVRWKGSNCGDTADYKPYLLQIHRRLKPRWMQKQVGMSMLHEMAHLKLGVSVDCEEWDGDFDKEMFRLAAVGAFQYFW